MSKSGAVRELLAILLFCVVSVATEIKSLSSEAACCANKSEVGCSITLKHIFIYDSIVPDALRKR